MGEAFGARRTPQVRAIILAAAAGLGSAATFAGAQAQSFPETAPCPTSQLAPFKLAPLPQYCPTANCLVPFANYQWWTAYTFNNQEGFYNGGLGTAFAPAHVYVAPDGLHLKVNNDVNLGGPPNQWTGAEAVLMFNRDNSEANLGYGDYLVTAKLITATSWAALDPNVALGMFTYERYGPYNPNTDPHYQPRGGSNNPWREIDLAEISRWGWDHKNPPNCPFGGNNGNFPNNILCTGNAQFALQSVPIGGAQMVQRYQISKDYEYKTITLVMKWHGASQPVVFEEYHGAYTLEFLPAPAFTWTTPASLNQFVPGVADPASCQRFHLNFWFGNYPNHPPPSSPQEAVITNFQFRLFSP